jgi:hypothetical protein
MTDLILSLIRSGGPVTNDGLLDELTILIRNGCVLQLPVITMPAVEACLRKLLNASKIEWTQSGWVSIRPEIMEQRTLFEEEP